MKHTRPATGASHARAALTITGAVVTLAPHARRVATAAKAARSGRDWAAVVTLAVHPTAHCRHCGHPLTDIATAIENLGYGPTCVTRTGV